MNLIIITGNLGKDPEDVQTRSGTPMCRFSVAVNEKRGDDETTTWFPVIAFGHTAEYALTYLQKGERVLIRGRMTCKQHNDKTYWDLIADNIERMSKTSKKADDVEEYTGDDPFADE